MKNELTEDERTERAEILHAIRGPNTRAKNKRTLYDVCCEIVARSQCMRHQGRLIDHYSASAYKIVYEALKPDARENLASIASENPVKAISICFKLCK